MVKFNFCLVFIFVVISTIGLNACGVKTLPRPLYSTPFAKDQPSPSPTPGGPINPSVFIPGKTINDQNHN